MRSRPPVKEHRRAAQGFVCCHPEAWKQGRSGLVGRRALTEGQVEAQVRGTGAEHRLAAGDAAAVLELLDAHG